MAIDKSSRQDIEIEDQRRMWNRWNTQHRENHVNQVSARQAELIEKWLSAAGAANWSILDAGCGTGWMCRRLIRFGHVTGIDLADEVVARARERVPEATFIAGDLSQAEWPANSFDAIVTMEVLAHMSDQPSLIRRLAAALKPNGLLLIASQNRYILERWSKVGPPEPGQLRRWLDSTELRSLLDPHFHVEELTSLVPVGDEGWLRALNSVKLNTVFNALFGATTVEAWKERKLYGHTLMARARKR